MGGPDCELVHLSMAVQFPLKAAQKREKMKLVATSSAAY
jgi:hypothetical protein